MRPYIVSVFRCLFLLTFLHMAGSSVSQTLPMALTDWLEHWQEEFGDEEGFDSDEVIDYYESLMDNPINLNDTHSNVLRTLPFIGDFRWRILKAYIALHGQLISVDELYLLNGYNRQLVELLKPIVSVAPVPSKDTVNLRQMLSQGRSQLLLGMGANIETSRGYREGIYEGDPLRLYARYQYHFKERVHLSLSADKDPGEAFFSGSQRQGFDFYSGHLLVNDIGIVKSAVLGHYNLQFGQGLTLWSGFAPSGSLLSEGFRYPRGIAAASAFAEQGYLQGLAVTVAFAPHWDMTAFYSNVARDASADVSGVVHGLSNSGYHRTPTEIAKKDLLREQLFGTHLQYRTDNIELGGTFSRTLLSDSIIPSMSIYNYYAFRGDENVNIGIDGRFRMGDLTLFGEVSLTSLFAVAAIGGVSLSLAPDHCLGFSLRHYDKDYYNLHNAPLSRTSGAWGEEGINIIYQQSLPWAIKSQFEVDLYRLSAMHYGIYAPSKGSVFRCSLSRQFTRTLQLNVGYVYRTRERNVAFEAPVYTVEQTSRRQLTAQLSSGLGAWTFRTRLSQCWFQAELSSSRQGFLVSQDIQYGFVRMPLALTMRFLLFDVDGYDARIYASESDLAYQFSAMAYSGQGLRFYMVARYAVTKTITLSAKYAITTHPNVQSIGSSYEQIDGDHRQSWKLQLRWNF
ncbi:MAG: hypothetical protein IJ764_06380 [Bacteroidales bacterium]|nr:hypothetical protein [Bacteroidales bacterium]